MSPKSRYALNNAKKKSKAREVELLTTEGLIRIKRGEVGLAIEKATFTGEKRGTLLFEKPLPERVLFREIKIEEEIQIKNSNIRRYI